MDITKPVLVATCLVVMSGVGLYGYQEWRDTSCKSLERQVDTNIRDMIVGKEAFEVMEKAANRCHYWKAVHTQDELAKRGITKWPEVPEVQAESKPRGSFSHPMSRLLKNRKEYKDVW